jgi:hypothetical protein
MNNLIISYDLMKPGQNYEAVIAAIKGLGSWAKVHYSLWYVSSSHTADRAAKIVRRALDENDKLIVVDATKNNAVWYNLPPEVSEHIQQNWNRKAVRISQY